MRRIALSCIALALVVAACGDDSTPVISADYQVIPPTNGSVSVRQDLTIRLRDSGMVIVRDGTDTLPGDGTNAARPNPRMTYLVEDPSMAVIDPYGIVRGIKPGTTTVQAVGFDQSVTFTLNILPYRATEVRFTVATRPNGQLIPQASRRDTGTFWALPADRQSTIVEGLVLVGNDTVYCNRCNRKTPARVQRLVHFRSLDETKLLVRNAANPYAQSTDNTMRSTDTAGRVIALDTITSEPVGIVMEVPGDEISDTVWVKLALRPINFLQIDADSADFPPSDIDDIGVERRKYPSSDTSAGNFVQATNAAFAVRADYFFTVTRPNTFGSQTNAAATSISILREANQSVERRRANRPLVEWESALPTYLELTPTDFNIASVTGPCAFISATCQSPSSQTARNALVLTCADNAGKLPGLDNNGRPNGGVPLQFDGPGQYTIPNCVPTKNIPMPGAFCTTANSADLLSSCTIWIRARTTDPATGNVLTDFHRINVRR